jgi:predicted Zn finger-like uncharacterized protein
MSMYTRCPHCDTHFRVSREQLQASSGQVRCGRCHGTFDAFATLTSQPPAMPEAAKRKPMPAGAAETDTPRDPGLPSRAPSLTPLDGLAGPRPVESQAARPEAQMSLAKVEALTLPDDLFGAGAPVQAKGRLWLWAGGTFALAVMLAAQAVYWFATDLAMQLPQLRPWLAEACVWLQCSVALPRMPDQLLVEASDLQVLDASRPAEVLLTASIRNRAPVAQELPLIELTLTDRLNQTAARKVFYPADYLDKSLDPRPGIGSNQELPIKLYLDTGDIKPAGYRLYVFFA